MSKSSATTSESRAPSRSALRLLQAGAEWLKAQLLDAALRGVAKEAGADEYGYQYVLDFDWKT